MLYYYYDAFFTSFQSVVPTVRMPRTVVSTALYCSDPSLVLQ